MSLQTAIHDDSQFQPNSNPRMKKVIITIALTLLVVAPLTCFVVIFTGSVSGTEFSPDTFERRFYTYVEIPFFHIQISPIIRERLPSALLKHLKNNNYITEAEILNPRWDIIYESRLKPNSPRCDARLLWQYLDRQNAGAEQSWLRWSKENPKLAKVFWPAIAKVARMKHYLLVPELFRLARQFSDPNLLKSEIDTYLNRQFQQLAITEQQLENHTMAVELYTQALSHNAKDEESLRGRAESYAALGHSDRASADRGEANRLAAINSGSQ